MKGAPEDPFYHDTPQCVARTTINEREQNEDSFHIYDLYVPGQAQPLKVLGLADGMGGHAYGEEVSRETLRKMSLSLFEQLCVEPAINKEVIELSINEELLEKILWNALEQANSYIRKMVQQNKWGKAGSTLLIVLLYGERGTVLYLGDSPLFHYRTAQRTLRQISEDHTIAGALLRAKKISPEMALHHEGKSRLEFYVGAETLPKHRSITHFSITAGDILLLCSDGVTGQLAHENIAQTIALHQDDLAALATYLFTSARSIGETDNQTAIIWRQERMPHQPPFAEHVSEQPKMILSGIPDRPKKPLDNDPDAKKQFRGSGVDESPTQIMNPIGSALQALQMQKQVNIYDEKTVKQTGDTEGPGKDSFEKKRQ